jgi:hypothetical protein
MSFVSYLPDSLKQASPAVAAETPPDVLAILRGNINDVFLSTSAPTKIQYTLPVPVKHGWETCVKASVMGATGKPLGERTYLVNIDHNQIGDRRDASDRLQNPDGFSRNFSLPPVGRGNVPMAADYSASVRPSLGRDPQPLHRATTHR